MDYAQYKWLLPSPSSWCKFSKVEISLGRLRHCTWRIDYLVTMKTTVDSLHVAGCSILDDDSTNCHFVSATHQVTRTNFNTRKITKRESPQLITSSPAKDSTTTSSRLAPHSSTRVEGSTYDQLLSMIHIVPSRNVSPVYAQSPSSDVVLPQLSPNRPSSTTAMTVLGPAHGRHQSSLSSSNDQIVNLLTRRSDWLTRRPIY